MLPYVIFGIGLALCWVFYNSREFNLFIILAVAYGVLSQFFWGKGLAGYQKEFLLNLLCILIPLNFLIFNFLKERGILNQHGIRRLLFVGAQIITAFWLLKTNEFGISGYVSMDIYHQPFVANTIIKQPAQLVICLSLVVLITHWLIRPNQLRGAWILALIAVLVALHFVLNTQLGTIYFMIAGLILLSAIIINSSGFARPLDAADSQRHFRNVVPHYQADS